MLINMMVGRDLKDLFPKQDVEIGKELLRIENLTVAHPHRSFQYLFIFIR